MNIYNALIYKKLYGGGGGGEIEVESLTATENKTYNAGEGKAYNPVVVAVPEPTLISKNITANGNYSASADNADGYSSVSVNVPLPSNAYLLKSIEHESIATFADGTDNFIKSLEVAIEPVQEGSGDPSPTNIRPISGWNECKVTVADDLENPTVSNVYTIDLNGTRYGGKLDVVNGVLTLTHGIVDLGSLTWVKGNMNTANTGRIFYSVLSASSPMKQPSDNGFCEALKYNPFSNWSAGQWERQILNGITVTNTAALVACVPDNYSSASDFKTAMNGVQLVYELATPLTIQLSPTIIKTLQGDNNFFANTGEIELLQYWGKEVIS